MFHVVYFISITVPSKIDEFRTNVNPRVIVNSPLTIVCPASGIPPPVISWYKDGEKMNVTMDENIQVDKDGEELTVKVSRVTDTGLYTCEAWNEAGLAKLNFDVFVEGLDSYFKNLCGLWVFLLLFHFYMHIALQ